MKRTLVLRRSGILYILASIASAIGAYCALVVVGFRVAGVHFLGVLMQAIIATAVGIFIYGVILYQFKDDELISFLRVIKTKFWKPKVLTAVPPQMDL
jgi:hypothetical protein